MAIPSRQIGWGTESNLLWQILKQITRLTSIMFSLKPKYKVFTALLTQSGGNDELGIQTGDLTIGVTYRIEETSPNSDWTNVGAPNNNLGTHFIATGTTPNSWGDPGNLRYNTGAPAVTVLENTIGNIWAIFTNNGNYLIKSDELFIDSKTTFSIGIGDLNISLPIFATDKFVNDSSTFSINTFDITQTVQNDMLYNTMFEIRVYN
jgi:hypothetical protein